jgi:diacylglycerol kinase (ATP)
MSPDPHHPRQGAVVVNPTKVDDIRALRDAVTAGMREAGWDTPLWLETTAEDPGYAMAEQALGEGVAMVLACGGDGTVRAVLTVLAGTGTPLGVLPAGTGNLLARNLGLPVDDLGKALDVALTGVVRPIDVGRIEPATAGGRVERFAVMAGVGFDAQMMRDAPKELKSTVGWPAYLVSAVENLRGSSIPLQVRLDDGQPIRTSARTVVDRYSTRQGTHIQISMRVSNPRQADGDLIGDSNRMDVQVEPGVLLILVPADSESSQAGNQPTEPASAGRPPERQSK